MRIAFEIEKGTKEYAMKRRDVLKEAITIDKNDIEYLRTRMMGLAAKIIDKDLAIAKREESIGKIEDEWT